MIDCLIVFSMWVFYILKWVLGFLYNSCCFDLFGGGNEENGGRRC
jgi:hypothetical protein